MLPLRIRVVVGAMTMKGYSAFPKTLVLLEHHHQIVYCHILDARWRRSDPSADMKSVYSIAPVDWAGKNNDSIDRIFFFTGRQVFP